MVALSDFPYLAIDMSIARPYLLQKLACAWTLALKGMKEERGYHWRCADSC